MGRSRKWSEMLMHNYFDGQADYAERNYDEKAIRGI